MVLNLKECTQFAALLLASLKPVMGRKTRRALGVNLLEDAFVECLSIAVYCSVDGIVEIDLTSLTHQQVLADFFGSADVASEVWATFAGNPLDVEEWDAIFTECAREYGVDIPVPSSSQFATNLVIQVSMHAELAKELLSRTVSSPTLAADTIYAANVVSGVQVVERTDRSRRDGDESSSSIRAVYLARVLESADRLSLAGVDPRAGTVDDEDSTLELSKLYVSLNAIGRRKTLDGIASQQKLSSELEIEYSHGDVAQFANEQSRLVLLGQPGSGKSTVAKYLALSMAAMCLLAAEPSSQRRATWQILSSGLDGEWDHGCLIPIRIVLRDFAAKSLGQGVQPTAATMWGSSRIN